MPHPSMTTAHESPLNRAAGHATQVPASQKIDRGCSPGTLNVLRSQKGKPRHRFDSYTFDSYEEVIRMRHATWRRRVGRFLTEGLGWIAAVAMVAGGGVTGADALPHAVNLIPDFQQHGLIPLAQGNRDDCSLFAVTGVTEFECARHAAAPPAGFRRNS